VTTAKQWTAPGPGRWEQDAAHQSAPFSRYGMRLVERYLAPGFEEAAARYGLLMRKFTVANVDGWMYVRADFVEDENGMTEREAAASHALATEAWRRDAEGWHASERQELRSRLLALQAVDTATLDAAALVHHLAHVEQALADGFHIHFRNGVAHWMGVGRWVDFVAGCTDVAPVQALDALRGASPASLDTLAYFDRLTSAIRTSSTAMEVVASAGSGADALEKLLHSSITVGEAIRSYLVEHGARTFTGFDLLDETVGEAPASLLGSIRARMASASPPTEGGVAAAGVRARVPAEHLVTYDALFDSAQLLYGVRDDDVGIAFHWPMGLLRLALLDAGRRLKQAGAVADAQHVFEADPEEVAALLQGSHTPSATVLAERVDARLDPSNAAAPLALGDEPQEPPPLDAFPPALRLVNGAFMVAQMLEGAAVAHEPPTQGGLTVQGLAASGGVYEGRACVVAGPTDFGRLRAGDVLVAPFTTPVYNAVLPMIGAVVTNHGGVLSHAAIVAREYGIPAIVATRDGTTRIPDGARVRVDGIAGVVSVL
jgi:phosphohistidine swiveling domain-containing protein